MFSPVFEITNRSLTGLIGIEVNKKLVEITPLEQDWESRLKQESLTKRTFSLFHFLENGLDLDDIAKIIKDEPGRDDKASEVASRVGVVGKEKDIQQVLNFLNANKLAEQIAFLTNKFKQAGYGINDLTKLNVLLGERLIPAAELGAYRQTDEVGAEQELTPLAVEVPFQIEDLFSWFGSTSKNELHSLLKIGTMVYELLRIKPYVSNNVATIFCFSHLLLAGEGYDFKKMWVMEEELLKNKETYFTAMSTVHKNKGDLTNWFEYFIRSANEASEKTKTKILNLVGETPIFKSGGGRVISLTERQIRIMEEITIRNEVTIKEIRSVLPMVSDDTILRDLKDLIDKKLIRKRGKTKGAVYVMGKVKGYR